MKIIEYFNILDKLKDLIGQSKFFGHVFAVGGCERDFMMGKDEVKDVDLCVDIIHGGIDFANYLYEMGALCYEPVIYENFGTCQFRLKMFPEYEIEAVHTRKETYRGDSRKPETMFGTIEEDATRRDFTYNAIYYDICHKKRLDINGRSFDDAKNNILRTCGNPDVIFKEDPLRNLRLIRFFCRFNSKIEDETYEGAKRSVHRLNIISKERIRDEFVKILVSDNPDIGINMLFELGAMKYVVPNLDENDWFAIERMFKCMKNEELIVKLAALYMYSTNPKFAMEYLKFSNDVIKEVLFLIETASEIDDFDFNSGIEDIDYHFDDRYSIRKLQYKCKTFEQLDKSARVYKHFYGHYFGKLIAANDKEVFEGTDMFDYKLPINGDDVMQILDIGPSKNIKYYLNTLLDIVLMFGPIFANKEHLIDKLKSIKENEKFDY